MCSHGWVHVKTWKGGGGTWSRHVPKFEARKASVRDTRLKEVMVRQLTKESVKQKRTKKAARQQNKKMSHFFATMVTL